MKPKKHTKTPIPLRAWTADDDRAPSRPSPLDDLTPLTAAAVMRAAQGLGWTEVVELSADIERRIQKALTCIEWFHLETKAPWSAAHIRNILTRPTVRKAKVLTKPQGASKSKRRAKR